MANSKTVRERAEKVKAAPNLGGSSNAKQASLLVGESLLAENKIADAIKEYDAALAEYDKADATKPLDPSKADGADVSLLLARAAARYGLQGADWNLTAAEGVIKDAARIVQLKPGPRLEAFANWYAANAKSKSLIARTPTFTAKKLDEYRESVVPDVRKAITLAPNDPGSWEWRQFGKSCWPQKFRLLRQARPRKP